MDSGARSATARPRWPARQRPRRQPAAPHFRETARSRLARPGVRAAGPAIQRAAAARTRSPVRWPPPDRSLARDPPRPQGGRRGPDRPRARAVPYRPAAPRQRSSAAAPNSQSTRPIRWWAPRWARARGPGWRSPAVVRRRRSRPLRGRAAATLTAIPTAAAPLEAIRTRSPPTASPRPPTASPQVAATIPAAVLRVLRAARPLPQKHRGSAPRTAALRD